MIGWKSERALRPHWSVAWIIAALISAIFAEAQAQTPASGVTFTQLGAGAVAQTQQTKNQQIINVFDYLTTTQIAGVQSLSCATDTTSGIQSALNAAGNNGHVVFPPGCYLVSATLQALPGQWLDGAGVNQTHIYRTGDYGDTLDFGTSSGTSAGPAHLSGFWFQHGTNYTTGDTSLNDPTTTGTSHVTVFGGQGVIIEHVWFWRLSYGLNLQGGADVKINDVNTVGYWDETNTALQEGIAQINIAYSSTFHNPTSVRVSGFQAGGGSSPIRTVSFSTIDRGIVTISMKENIGSQYNILSTGCEDCSFGDSYFGGANNNNLEFIPQDGSSILDIRIHDNHFDGAGVAGSDLVFNDNSISSVSRGIQINGNTFNAEGISFHQISMVNGPSNQIDVLDATITGNTFFVSNGTPLFISGASNLQINGNVISSYNNNNISNSDPSYVAALFILGQAQYVSVLGNILCADGGYTYYGVVQSPGLTGVTVPSNKKGSGCATNFYGGMDGGQWIGFTPIISYGGGSGVSTSSATGSYYMQSDKTLCYSAQWTVNYSIPPTSVILSIPNSALSTSAQIAMGRNQTAGYGAYGLMFSAANTVLVQKYDGSVPLGSGASSPEVLAVGPVCIAIQ